VVETLREHGLDVRSEIEVFGRRPEGVPDVEWLERAGREGWVVLSKDKRLRHDRDQRATMVEHRVKAFVLTSGTLKAPEQANRFLANIRRIERAALAEKVSIYAVHAGRIERLWPQ
jgi:Rad3-related DNA helicase